jgi:hypothetical protein
VNDVQGAVAAKQDFLAVGRPARYIEVWKTPGGDPPESGAVGIDDEQRNLGVRRPGRILADEDQPASIGRVATGLIVAAGIRGDLGQAAAVRGADRPDAVFVVAPR